MLELEAPNLVERQNLIILLDSIKNVEGNIELTIEPPVLWT